MKKFEKEVNFDTESNSVWMRKISDFIITNITSGDNIEDLAELIATIEEYLDRLKSNYEEDED